MGGDAYGYEDSGIEGYYNEYKEQFDELSALSVGNVGTLKRARFLRRL